MKLKTLILLMFFIFSIADAVPKHCENPTAELLTIQESLREQIRVSLIKELPVPKLMECKAEDRINGQVSYYGKDDSFGGKLTANEQVFNPMALTAAHKTLPFGTRVRVTNKKNNRSVIVTITDRGPYAKDRVLDVSYRAAQILGFVKAGHAEVTTLVCASTKGG